MFCRNCGNQIPDGTAVCPHCGQGLTAATAPQTVESHLVFAVLTAVFCCQPFGIVATIYAAQVSSLVNSGNIPAAQEASEKARKWALAGLICGLVLYPIVILLQVAGAFLQAAN